MMKENKGVTLTELIIVVLLLSIVIALGYQTLHYFQSSSKRTEQKWVEQDAVVLAVEVIESRIKSSTIVSLYTALPETDMVAGFGYFFNKDGYLYFKSADAGSIPEKVVDYPLAASFSLGTKMTAQRLQKSCSIQSRLLR
jgi:prepilin-type N-terminal cleavage/methylation domain-containing protein